MNENEGKKKFKNDSVKLKGAEVEEIFVGILTVVVLNVTAVVLPCTPKIFVELGVVCAVVVDRVEDVTPSNNCRLELLFISSIGTPDRAESGPNLNFVCRTVLESV